MLLEEQWKLSTKPMNSLFQKLLSYFSIVDNPQLFMFLVKSVIR